MPTVAPLPTLEPSQVSTSTPAIVESEQTLIAPTLATSPTLPVSPTSPLGSTSAISESELPTLSQGMGGSQSPVIEYFMASPEQAAPGEPVVLVWATLYGTNAAITQLDADGQQGESWTVELEGSLTVSPASAFQPETYILTLTNGITVIEERLTIEVTCGFSWFFSPPPDDICPTGEPASSPAGMQEFERGKMVLIEELDLIIILFEDLITESDQSKPAWRSIPNPYEEGMEGIEPAVPPPDGKSYPQHGFGTVWRYTATVEDRLGWAVSGEVSFNTTYQNGLGDEGEQFYFTNIQGEVITLVPDGKGWLVAGYE
ncbi:MAG: hypothetical protein JXJ17_14980 [Anaerolineae bacterium]|nr:hypothetical protein [Anaerolineae bacterium]